MTNHRNQSRNGTLMLRTDTLGKSIAQKWCHPELVSGSMLCRVSFSLQLPKANRFRVKHESASAEASTETTDLSPLSIWHKTDYVIADVFDKDAQTAEHAPLSEKKQVAQQNNSELAETSTPKNCHPELVSGSTLYRASFSLQLPKANRFRVKHGMTRFYNLQLLVERKSRHLSAKSE